MIDAIIGKKAKTFFLKNDSKIPFEDCLISAVFGPLRYMPPTLAWRGVEALLGLDPSANKCNDFDISFWRLGGPERVEMDIVIDGQFEFDGQFKMSRRKLLVEAKWNAPLGDRQVARQRVGFAVDGNSALEQYVLVRYRGVDAVRSHIEKTLDASTASLVTVKTWRAASRELNQLVMHRDHADGLARWAKGCATMLREFGERDFVGFDRLSPWSLSTGPTRFLTEQIGWPTPRSFQDFAPTWNIAD